MKIERCPKPGCNGAVSILPSYGGRGTGQLTAYFSECKKCGAKVDHLGNGPLRSGITAWNKYAAQVRRERDGDN